MSANDLLPEALVLIDDAQSRYAEEGFWCHQSINRI